MNSLGLAGAEGGSPGLLERLGIVVLGEQKALDALADTLARLPVGAALVYIAQQGRKHGIRLRMDERFNRLEFALAMKRYEMQPSEVAEFIANVLPPPAPISPNPTGCTYRPQ